MHCETYQKLFFDYVNRSLPGGMRGMVREHLQGCNSCRFELDQLNKFSRSVTELLKSTTSSLLMTSETQAAVLERVEALGPESLLPQAEWLKLFEELPFWERVRKMVRGLQQPKESGEYKWARLQMMRLSAPVAGILVPAMALLIATIIVAMEPRHSPPVQVNIKEEMLPEELKPPEQLPEPDIQPPEPTDIVQVNDTFIPSTSKETSVGPDADFSPQPSPLDAVAIIKSPVIMKGIFGSRSPGARGSALGRYGGSGNTEGAVMRALRWLKKYQEEDGSWRGSSGNSTLGDTQFPEALTSLAILTYLAHGETPASPEFGKTVDKAIRWLVEHQGADGHYSQTGGSMDYTHPICTYALAEAYGMTKLAPVKAAAEKALDYMLKNQHADGGWDYSCKMSGRIDVSITSWCVQALKAAKIAGLSNSTAIEDSMKRARDAFTKVFYRSTGGYFRYDNTANYPNSFWSLTGAAVLSLQLMGQANSPEARAGLEWLNKNATCDWQNPTSESPLYHWYYITQAKFHTGGETWKAWNKQFAPALVKNQIVVKGGGIDGKDIGYWPLTGRKGEQYDGKSFVYCTTMCALQLQVYYRYLPTYQTPGQAAADEQEVAKEKENRIQAKDLDIQIKM